MIGYEPNGRTVSERRFQPTHWRQEGRRAYSATPSPFQASHDNALVSARGRSRCASVCRAIRRGARSGERTNKPLGLSALRPVPENIVKSVVLARIGNLWTEEYLAYRQAIVVGALRSKHPGRPKPRLLPSSEIFPLQMSLPAPHALSYFHSPRCPILVSFTHAHAHATPSTYPDRRPASWSPTLISSESAPSLRAGRQ